VLKKEKMYKLTGILFLLFSFNAFSQGDWNINFMAGYDYTFIEDFNRENAFNPDFEYTPPVGMSFELSVEKRLPNQSSISTGLGYSKINLYPDLEITYYYGGRLIYEDDTLWVNSPRLKQIQIETFSIPIRHKQYFQVGKKCSIYAMAGVVASFQISQKERYEDAYFNNIEGELYTPFTAKQQNLKLFNTVFELGGGLTYHMTNDLSIIFQFNADVVDFRRANPIVTTLWPMTLPDSQWWEDSFLPLGQLSMSLGVQKSFLKK